MNQSCGLQSSTDMEILIHSSQAKRNETNGELHQDSVPAPVEHRPHIRAHFDIGYMVLCGMRHLEARNQMLGKSCSPTQIHENLCNS